MGDDDRRFPLSQTQVDDFSEATDECLFRMERLRACALGSMPPTEFGDPEVNRVVAIDDLRTVERLFHGVFRIAGDVKGAGLASHWAVWKAAQNMVLACSMALYKARRTNPSVPLVSSLEHLSDQWLEPHLWEIIREALLFGWNDQLVDAKLLRDEHATSASLLVERVPQRADSFALEVDVLRLQARLNGRVYSIRGQITARWLKVLADNPEVWISATEMERYDPELLGVRTSRCRRLLPPALTKLIETSKRNGARLVKELRPKAK